MVHGMDPSMTRKKGPPMPWGYRLIAIFLFLVLIAWMWTVVR